MFRDYQKSSEFDSSLVYQMIAERRKSRPEKETETFLEIFDKRHKVQ